MPNELDKKLFDARRVIGSGGPRIRQELTYGEISDQISHQLKGSLEVLLEDPCSPNGSLKAVDAMSVFLVCTYLPANAPDLQRGFDFLRSTVDPSKDITVDNFSRRLAAILILDKLLYQTTLPIQDRYIVQEASSRKERRQAIKTGVDFAKRVVPDASFRSDAITDVVNGFKAKTEEMLRAPTRNRNHAAVKIHVADQVLKLWKSYQFKSYDNTARPETVRWVEETYGPVPELLGSEHALDLLLDGSLVSTEPVLRAGIWNEQWGQDFAINQEKARSLAMYFFTHHDIWLPFWDMFTKIGFTPFADPNLNKHMLNGQPALEWFFAQDQEMLGLFMNSLKVSEIALAVLGNLSQIAMLLGRSAGITADFQTRFPDHENTPKIRDLLKDLAQAAGVDRQLRAEFAVLEDGMPGAICFTDDSQVRVKTPKANQGKEAFIKDLGEQGLDVVYISHAVGEQKKSGQEGKKAVQKDVVVRTTGNKRRLPAIGEVAVANPFEAENLFGHLAKLLSQYHIDQARAFDILIDIDSKTKSVRESSLVVFPDLLPLDHSLAVLVKLGIVAVVENGDVNFVFEPARVGFKSNESRVAIFSSQIVDNDLRIGWIKREIVADTPLQILLSAAILLSRTDFSENALTKDDLSALRSNLKAYNAKAKQENRPQVQYDENPRARDPKNPLTVTFLGKKPVILSVLPVA